MLNAESVNRIGIRVFGPGAADPILRDLWIRDRRGMRASSAVIP